MDNKEKEVVFLRNRYRKRYRSEDCYAITASRFFLPPREEGKKAFGCLAIGSGFIREWLVLFSAEKGEWRKEFDMKIIVMLEYLTYNGLYERMEKRRYRGSP